MDWNRTIRGIIEQFIDSPENTLANASNWSERHAAYATGLGTFGLCDGLITPVGKSMNRGSSVIARIDIPHTERPHKTHREYCLFFSEGSCGACITRCPAGVISKTGHDKEKCKAYVDNVGGVGM
jgi:epoxyqueuosine reductase